MWLVVANFLVSEPLFLRSGHNVPVKLHPNKCCFLFWQGQGSKQPIRSILNLQQLPVFVNIPNHRGGPEVMTCNVLATYIWLLATSWSEVTQSCLTLCDPVDCSPSGSSIYGILQARILEWVAISFSRGSSWPRNQTWVSCIAGRQTL